MQLNAFFAFLINFLLLSLSNAQSSIKKISKPNQVDSISSPIFDDFHQRDWFNEVTNPEVYQKWKKPSSNGKQDETVCCCCANEYFPHSIVE